MSSPDGINEYPRNFSAPLFYIQWNRNRKYDQTYQIEQ